MSALEHLNLIFKSVLSYFSSFNWVDAVIILVFAFYAVEGFALGFTLGLVDFLSFALSFLIALKYYALLGSLLVKTFSLSIGFADAIGFLLAAFLSEIIIGAVFRKFTVAYVSKKFHSNKKIANLDKTLGVLPGLLSSAVLITFFLTLVISLPLSPFLKNAVFSSKIGSLMVSNTQGLEKRLNNVFGGAVSDTLNFLTVEPKSEEAVKLNFTTDKFSTDFSSEQQMFAMVNSERASRGISKLSFDENLAKVGRAHCEDMFVRGYFSHYTPEGLSPFDRMSAANISFNAAGENLALAPNVTVAMQGLMQSPGHKANILSTSFGRVGVGVIDGGIYGEMFCQEFTD